MNNSEKCSVDCSVYITNLSLDSFAKGMIRLSEKYKDYKIERVEMQPNIEWTGSNLIFKMVKK